MNKEEAIKILEDICKVGTQNYRNIKGKLEIVKPAYIKAIDTVLQVLEKLQKENQTLKYKIEGKECVIETQTHNEEVYQKALDDKNKQLQAIQEEFLKYNWEIANGKQVANQVKSLYYSIFRKEKVEE